MVGSERWRMWGDSGGCGGRAVIAAGGWTDVVRSTDKGLHGVVIEAWK